MNRLKGLWRNRFTRLLAIPTILMMVLSVAGMATPGLAAQTASTGTGSCTLGPQGNIKHVIYVQFDNVHFTRDNPNVPSDLEQMPNLLNFLEGNGTLLTNHHTPLISHTADDILTSLTGVYGDQHGQPIANSFRYFNPNGTSNPGVSFAYWTDPIFDPSTSTPTDKTFNMITAKGLNAPAPWVPYTRAGCNVGAAGTANIELENTSIDVAKVFGPNSPQAQEAKNNPNQASADFVGIAVHCAKGNTLCSSANTGVADKLPNEPGGYTGYNALFGNKYVAPQISPGGPMRDLNGNIIKDPFSGDIGFPGFDGMLATVSLSYVAAMQEHGVPVTYAYISDAHDNHAPTGPFTYGPGEAGYVAQLKAYDTAFGKFFARLAKDGINKSNTLFVFTADEGDHFVGGTPQPTNCDGVTIPCTYNKIGEIDGNLTGLLATEQGITTPFQVHADSAPVFYVTGRPSRTATVTRNLERAVGKLTGKNVYTGKNDLLTRYLADPVEMNFLHMITGDPARTATFTMFADPNYFLFTGAPNCSSPCTSLDTGFAWNHGDVNPDINVTWLGMVGPGVKSLGQDGNVWSDHTDIRPTMMELLGLKDDYSHEGRVLFEIIQPAALPPAVRKNLSTLITLGQTLKQIDAPVGTLGLETLSISTTALESNAPNDSTYTQLEQQLSNMTVTRNALAAKILATLESAEFGGGSVDLASANQLINQANALLAQAKQL